MENELSLETLSYKATFPCNLLLARNTFQSVRTNMVSHPSFAVIRPII